MNIFYRQFRNNIIFSLVQKFLGNPLEDITIRHRLLKYITTEKVYIMPTRQSSTGCLRIELYGYKKDEIPNTGK